MARVWKGYTYQLAHGSQVDPDKGDVQIFVKDTVTQSISCVPKYDTRTSWSLSALKPDTAIPPAVTLIRYDTVEQLMLKIQKRTGCLVAQQLLSIRGKPVSYNSRIAKKTIHMLGVQVGAAHFFFRAHCGSFHIVSVTVCRPEQPFFSLPE